MNDGTYFDDDFDMGFVGIGQPIGSITGRAVFEWTYRSEVLVLKFEGVEVGNVTISQEQLIEAFGVDMVKAYILNTHDYVLHNCVGAAA